MATKVLTIGNIPFHRGIYSDSVTYYVSNQVTMCNSVFQLLSNNVTGVPPLKTNSDGTVSLVNTTVWQCLLDNVAMYNRTLSANSLDTRITRNENTLEEKADKITVVEQTESIVTINPGVLNLWTTSVSTLAITFAGPADTSMVNEYMLRFTTSASGLSISLPSTIKWNNTIEWEANTTYEISVIDNFGVMVKWSD